MGEEACYWERRPAIGRGGLLLGEEACYWESRPAIGRAGLRLRVSEAFHYEGLPVIVDGCLLLERALLRGEAYVMKGLVREEEPIMVEGRSSLAKQARHDACLLLSKKDECLYFSKGPLLWRTACISRKRSAIVDGDETPRRGDTRRKRIGHPAQGRSLNRYQVIPLQNACH